MARQTEVDPGSDPTLQYLKHRVRAEAAAAVNATSVEATSVHVTLATAYAKRCGETSAIERQATAAWVDENRLW